MGKCSNWVAYNHRIGTILYRPGNYDEALRCYRIALDFWEQTQNIGQIVVIKHGIAYLYYVQEEYETAITIAQEGCQICDDTEAQTLYMEEICQRLRETIEGCQKAMGKGR